MNKKILALPALLGAPLLFMGTTDCEGLHHGGGFVKMLDGSKATFGYQIRCEDAVSDDSGNLICQDVSGSVQLNDAAAQVKIHGNVISHKGACGFDENEYSARFEGTYVPQPRHLGPGGTFSFCAKDYGEPGRGQDQIRFEIETGIHEGYQLLLEVIDGGNLQFKELPGRSD